jgi:GNAT superfamily N-acetyltransferase
MGNDPVGYVRLYLKPSASVTVVECCGEVFPEMRGRGVGGLLLDWVVASGLEHAGTDLVEIVVDRTSEDLQLRSLLTSRGFSQAEMRQLVAPVVELAPTAADGDLDVSDLRSADTSELIQLYMDTFDGEPWSQRASATWTELLDGDLIAPEMSVVVRDRADGLIVGYLLALVWQDDPSDVWIESVCHRRGAHTVGRFLISEMLRRGWASQRFRTASVGLRDGDGAERARAYEALGFVTASRWSRHTLLLHK